MVLTFEQLPDAVAQLHDKLENIERLLLQKDNEPQPPPDELLTIKQAAQLLCLSVATLYSLVSRAAIPVSKRGKRLYFSKAELLEWVKAGRKKTTTEIAAEAAQYLTKNKKA
jgi:excisionase family DNA binding protein